VSDLASIMRAEARRRGVALEVRRAPETLAIMGEPQVAAGDPQDLCRDR
jgi:hypothetical protein